MEQDLLTKVVEPTQQAAAPRRRKTSSGGVTLSPSPLNGSDIARADIFEQLLFLQQKLFAGKTERNASEGFPYRSEDGILSALKPLLAQCRCTVTFRDEVLSLTQGYVYLRTTCSLNNAKGQSAEAYGYAREDLVLPGKCQAQITGSCSTYAHKYALKSLLLLTDDPVRDAVDPDSGCYRDPLGKSDGVEGSQQRAEEGKPATGRRPPLTSSVKEPVKKAAATRVELVPGSREFNSAVMKVVQQKGEHTFAQYGEWIRRAYDISDENLRVLLARAGRKG